MTGNEPDKSNLQPMQDDARRQIRTIVRSARYAALATIDRADGAPAASRVSLATAMNGDPVFLISRLSGHYTNLEHDPRCSLLVGEPGKGDPLAHPRITLTGRATRLERDSEARQHAKGRYLMRHPKAALYAEFPDFDFWRFSTRRASFNGGFGKAFAPTPADLLCDMTDCAPLEAAEASAVVHMNADHADTVARYAESVGARATAWKLACIDPEGLDMTAGDDTARLWFDTPVRTPDDLHETLVDLARRLRSA